MNDIALAGMVIGIVGIFRKQALERWPKANGWRVPLLTLLVSVLVCFAYTADGGEDLTRAWVLDIFRHAVRIAGEAMGATYIAGYGGAKVGEKMGAALTTERPPAGPPTSQRAPYGIE